MAWLPTFFSDTLSLSLTQAAQARAAPPARHTRPGASAGAKTRAAFALRDVPDGVAWGRAVVLLSCLSA